MARTALTLCDCGSLGQQVRNDESLQIGMWPRAAKRGAGFLNTQRYHADLAVKSRAGPRPAGESAGSLLTAALRREALVLGNPAQAPGEQP
jgi:hypothetical protein